ncbi:MAG: adenylyl-sulfate kinase, partial [Spirochaetales bacterium]|nr:adenylyl-sulfate kinase [Spirochaetales bacterium]
REQGITIDVAYRYFSTNKRKFIIADTPGHEQYTRNMITGGSTADLAIILIDATQGVLTQTKRHTFLVDLLGIQHVILAVNKMDLVDYSQEVFDEICKEYKTFITRLDIPDVQFVPISALKGDNVISPSERFGWYTGKPMLEILETIHVVSDRNFIDLRYPVQYVLRPGHDFRGFSGELASGILRPGDDVMVLPSRKKSRVKSLVSYDGDLDYAFPPQSITVTLEDEIDVSRGDMLVHPHNIPRVERHFEATLVWMDEAPMDPSTQFFIKQTTNTAKARIDEVRYKIDVNTLHRGETELLELNEIGRVVITTTKPLYFDPYQKNASTGSFVLIDPVTHNTSAVGMIIDRMDSEDLPSKITDADWKRIVDGGSLVSREERIKRYGQRGGTLWITGLHGSGKKELVYGLEKHLFDLGASCVVLDGGAIRSGLSRELDFSDVDRAEHLRRVAHICRLLNSQGLLVLCSFISPAEDIREQIAEIVGEEQFHLIHMDADLEYCRSRASDELYSLAEEGKVEDMPGVDMPYDAPESPALTFHPDSEPVDGQISKVLDYLHINKIFPAE